MKKQFSVLQQIVSVVLSSLLFAGMATTVAADSTYNNYVYNSLDESVECPAAYLPETLVTGEALGTGKFKNASDLYERNGQLYILDGGNNRILKLSGDMQLLETITLKKEDGSAIKFTNATGLFVTKEENLYVCDEEAKVVYLAKSDGKVYAHITEPKADVLPDGFDYRPNKIVEDSAGVIYILSKGTIGGALQYDAKLKFMGFFGSERVQSTAQIITQRLWRLVMTEKQREGMASFAPATYVNFDTGSDDFIYTIRDQAESRKEQVRKLNAAGNNILHDSNKTIFGDVTLSEKGVDSLLTDIEVDSENFISVLDARRGRIFQYNQDSDLLYVFGRLGSQTGTFKTATALESIGNKIVVLDKDNATVTVFAPTQFALDVRKAVLLFDDGMYEQAMEPWKAVLKQASNYELGNIGMGKALIELGDYKAAMKHFRIGRDRSGYSDAFEEYRGVLISKWFPLILLALIAVVSVVIFVSRRSVAHAKNDYTLVISRQKYPLYCMLHPFKGFNRLKEEKKGSLPMALLITAVFFVVSIISHQATGFIFNENPIDKFNIFVQLGKTVGVLLVFVLANWAVSTIIDGKGTLREVFIFGSYSLLPYVICTIPAVLLSNAIIEDEGPFYHIVLTLIIAWTCITILMAVKEVHQFSLKKTILVILLTLFGILIVISVVAILYSMFVQMFGWITTIANELLLRS